MIREPLLQIRWAVKIGKTLRQVDSLMLLRQGAHLGENSGAEVGEFALGDELRCCHSSSAARKTDVKSL